MICTMHVALCQREICLGSKVIPEPLTVRPSVPPSMRRVPHFSFPMRLILRFQWKAGCLRLLQLQIQFFGVSKANGLKSHLKPF